MGKDRRKKKKVLLLLLLLLGVASATGIAIGLGVGLSSKKSHIDTREQALLDNRTPIIQSFNNSSTKITNKNVNRNINKNVYETSITQQYGSDFKYPSWNYNYEANNNRYQTINGVQVDGMQLVYDERVSFNGSDVYYSDPNFILSEIQNGTLKKHPVADVWFEQQIPDSAKAIEKSFSIPSYTVGNTVLGLYVAPGEIATLTFDKDTLDRMSKQGINNFNVILNSSFWNNFAPGDTGQISNRYPYLKTTFTLNVSDLVANNGVFKFGSPFGGTVSIAAWTGLKSDSYNLLYPSYTNYKFTVSGCLEMLSYFHNITTEEDWNNQVQRVLSGEIVAPAMCIDFSYGTMNVASTAIKQFAYQNVQDIPYPFEIMEKWTQFLFVSEYFKGNDLIGTIPKLDFEFNDDIWGGAAAYGGGNKLYSPLSWAKGSFLSGYTNWNIKNNWGTFHEINHNFEQNSASFQTRSHPGTNQVTMTVLSLISDEARWKSLYNPTGSNYDTNSWWTRLGNMYTTIKRKVNDGYATEKENEYDLQAMLLYTLGSYNFMNYLRYDSQTNPNDGGFKEIVEYSDYFKLNFWPAISQYTPIWDDGWPASYDVATAEQKKEIDRLNKSYKAFDFVANVYSVGPYIYNNKTNKFDYTNDMQAPIDIPAGREYVLDFEQGIVSINKNFAWNNLSFDSRSKLGATIKRDPSNNKKLIYIPKKGTEGQVDEFNVSIKPTNFTNKPSNYVSQYIWKIKLRTNPSSPVLTLYNEPITSNNSLNFYKDYDYMSNPENELASLSTDPTLGQIYANPYSNSGWNRARLSFSFIAPKTGTYDFQIKADSFIFIVNEDDKPSDSSDVNKFWWKTGSNQIFNREFGTIKSGVSMSEGEQLNLSIYYTYNTSSSSTKVLQFQAIYNGDENNPINVFENCVVPWANDLIDDPRKFLTDEKYKYQTRSLIMNDFQTSLMGINASRTAGEVSKLDENGQNNYTFNWVSHKVSAIDSLLSYADNKWYELWDTWSEENPFTVKFNAVFNNPTTIRTIIFTHRTNNWSDGRPTSMKISDENGKVLYDGKYGAQNNDRMAAKSIFTFDKDYVVSKLNFEFTNTTLISNNGSKTAIILDAIEFASSDKLDINKLYSVQNPNIAYYGNWSWANNSQGINISDINEISACSSSSGDSMEFTLYAQAFDLVGQLNSDLNFDVYINGKLVQNVSTSNQERKDNQILYSYTSNSSRSIKVKIVNRTDNNLFINYLQTYGDKTELTK